MDWITSLQNAINYVEDHLTEPLDYAEIGKQAYSSPFHFQRAFSMLCGYTLGEYIRNRRLTLAGIELASSDARVIDTALKYGYDSPGSFARAFTRFHGITPSQAKKCGTSLRSFSRLSVKLILDGGSMMKYRIEKKEAFNVIGRKQNFSTDMERSKKQIPQLWDACRNDGTIPALCGYLPKDSFLGESLLGVCFEAAGDKKEFPYMVGVEYRGGAVKNGLTVEMVPARTWAIFECVGAMPDAFHALYQQLYSEFFPTSEYQPTGGVDMEVYPDGDIHSPQYKCELWIAVEKK